MATEVMSPSEGRTREVIIRELGPDEVHLLYTLPPFNVEGVPAFGHSRVIVGQDKETGAIVAYWFIFDAVHVEPVWIDFNFRKRPGLIRRLWGKVREVLEESKVPGAFAMVDNAAVMPNASQAVRLGFKRLPGELYYLRLSDGREA